MGNDSFWLQTNNTNKIEIFTITISSILLYLWLLIVLADRVIPVACLRGLDGSEEHGGVFGSNLVLVLLVDGCCCCCCISCCCISCFCWEIVVRLLEVCVCLEDVASELPADLEVEAGKRDVVAGGPGRADEDRRRNRRLPVPVRHTPIIIDTEIDNLSKTLVVE